MLVSEFLEAYPQPISPPTTGVEAYDRSRLLAHELGAGIITALNGGTIGPEFLDGLEEEATDINDKFAEIYQGIDPADEEKIKTHLHEGSHFYFLNYSRCMQNQLSLLLGGRESFMGGNSLSDLRLSLFGSNLYDAQRVQAKSNPAYFGNNSVSSKAFFDGVLNEIDASIALLDMARYVKKQQGRKLLIIPAPPQIEWYNSSSEGFDGSNHHADILVVEHTPNSDSRICGVQVKSVVKDEIKDKYDPKRLVMVCGNADLGNYSSQLVDPVRMRRKNTNWAGQLSIESLVKHTKTPAVRGMINSAERKRVLTMLCRHTLNKGSSHVDIRRISKILWDRVAPVLGQEFADGDD